ncbi:hypothetical protein HPULCUR_006219 [Helicostylum pulchrum]|uniref:Uncharacterized protein n=1 Tax=Helicostylum pulchrum TaxID=562976 RepID=A0ABP9Y1B4_9FUNG
MSRFIPPRIEDIKVTNSGSGSPTKNINDKPAPDLQKKTQDPRRLLDAVKNLMRTRHGSVLSRNTILKMDHFEKGMHTQIIKKKISNIFVGTNSKLDFHLQGAPNFRVAELNVYGVAQPTVRGFI